MYEGENKIVFSKETMCKLFSKFMSDLFHSPLKVTSLESDYKGLTVDFTEDKEASDAVEPSKESEVVS